MGYIRGFIHGAVAGTIVGICVAPQPGERTRAQLGSFGRAARDSYDLASRTVRQVAPVVSGAASVARSQVGRMRHQEASGVHQENGQR
jgi:gas vesicle protein